MCSETSSPRLSFSNDVPLQDHRRDSSLMEIACDFEFSFISSFSVEQSSSADELFSHGVILPTNPRERVITVSNAPQCSLSTSLPPLPTAEKPKQSNGVGDSDTAAKPQAKSFWGSFKRSSSLNSENKRALLCPIPLLSRSKSTGSVLSQKRSGLKEASRSSQKQPLISMARSSSSSSSSSLQQKPPLKKSYGGSYGNGIRVIPVINVPPPYISKGTAKFFGLGSFLHHDHKDKSKR